MAMQPMVAVAAPGSLGPADGPGINRTAAGGGGDGETFQATLDAALQAGSTTGDRPLAASTARGTVEADGTTSQDDDTVLATTTDPAAVPTNPLLILPLLMPLLNAADGTEPAAGMCDGQPVALGAATSALPMIVGTDGGLAGAAPTVATGQATSSPTVQTATATTPDDGTAVGRQQSAPAVVASRNASPQSAPPLTAGVPLEAERGQPAIGPGLRTQDRGAEPARSVPTVAASLAVGATDDSSPSAQASTAHPARDVPGPISLSRAAAGASRTEPAVAVSAGLAADAAGGAGPAGGAPAEPTANGALLNAAIPGGAVPTDTGRLVGQSVAETIPATDATTVNRLGTETRDSSPPAGLPAFAVATDSAATGDFGGSSQMGDQGAGPRQDPPAIFAGSETAHRAAGAMAETAEPAAEVRTHSTPGDPHQATAEEGADRLRADAVAVPLAGPGTHRPVDAALPVEHAAQPGPPLAAQLAQGVELASQRPGHTVRLTLQPEGLGEVSLQVGLGPGGVHIHIGVDSAAVRDLVRGSANDLAQALSQRGVAIEGFAVDLANGQARGGFGGQSAYQSPTPSYSYPSRAAQPTGESRRAEAPEPSSNRVDYRV